MGTNASYFIPREVAKNHEVMILEGPAYEAEAGLIVVENRDLNIKMINETEFKKKHASILKFVDQFQPDIIHLFYHHQALQLGQEIRKKYGNKIKLLLDIRTPLLEDKWLNRLRVQIRNIWFQGVFDMVATHSSYSVKTVFPISWLPIREVSYGVDVAAIKVRNSPWQKKDIDLVYVGAIAKKRKIGQLLLSFKILLERIEAQQYSFTLHLYGAGNHMREMKRLVETLGIQDHVVFHGLIKQSDLSQNLHKNAIGISYVPFGIYKQAPALKTLEYICAGLSVFASNTQPIKDLIAEGFRLDTYDNSEDGFANGILNICKKGWNEEITKGNLALINKFDWKHIVETTVLPTYQELAGK